MTGKIVKFIGVTALLVATAPAFTEAQRGKPSGARPAVADFDCVTPDSTRGICGPSMTAEMTGSGLNELRIASAAGIQLAFNGQQPDCSSVECRWPWGDDPVSSFTSFSIGANTIGLDGATEVEGGLLGLAVGESARARFNMTVTVPGSTDTWRFNFNPEIPPGGGADLADVVRTGNCTWVFSAGTQHAVLSSLVKPAKGKQYVHVEGSFQMPFNLTFTLSGCSN